MHKGILKSPPTVIALLLAVASVSPAQITSAPNVTVGLAQGKFMGKTPENLRPPSPDPRDLNGMYVPDLEHGFGPGGSEPGAPTLGEGAEDTAATRCIPEMDLDGSAYAQQIIQTPGRVTLIDEYNHVVRRIYLDTQFPDHMEPTYSGYSVGHWEGDVLVIETRGLKGTRLGRLADMKAVTRVVERIRKVDGGKRVENIAAVEGVGRDRKHVTSTLRSSMVWRPDLRITEFICEDGAGLFYSK